MSRRSILRGSLAIIFIITAIFVIIPAVLFANSAGYNPGQTVVTRTPASVGWLPVISNQPTYTPTPTQTPSPTPTMTSTPITSCTPFATIDANNAAIEIVMQSEINSQRANNGSLAGYRLNDQLVQAARRHAQNMGSLTDSQLSDDPHKGTDGTVAVDRIADACYLGSNGSEIVGWGFSSLDVMMTWWMGSTFHRPIILSTDLDEYGPTYFNLPNTQYTHYWTVTFGSSTGTRSADLAYQCTYVIAEEDRGISATVWQDTPCE